MMSKQNLQMMGGVAGALLIIVIILVVLFWLDIIPGGSTPSLPQLPPNNPNSAQPSQSVCDDNTLFTKRIKEGSNDCTKVRFGPYGKSKECDKYYYEVNDLVEGRPQLGNKCVYSQNAGKCIPDGNNIRIDGCKK